tara:strand:+ start:4175 stop:4387 length:213 start_codon:yes stop_codon:yes gene_type:complete
MEDLAIAANGRSGEAVIATLDTVVNVRKGRILLKISVARKLTLKLGTSFSTQTIFQTLFAKTGFRGKKFW